jgi:hypothetical protein
MNENKGLNNKDQLIEATFVIGRASLVVIASIVSDFLLSVATRGGIEYCDIVVIL